MHAFQNDDKMKGQVCFERLDQIENEVRQGAMMSNLSEFEALMRAEGPYDYVFNLSALKHVRSEKDPYTLMRLIEVNILNTIKTVNLSRKKGVKKYFCVSTDKAANPVNMMGASKRIMEKFLAKESHNQKITMARFANVAFSDGSLLHGFNQRFSKRQPISAPNDIKRYYTKPNGTMIALNIIMMIVLCFIILALF